MIAVPTDTMALGTGQTQEIRQEGWPHDTILLVLTYSNLERYLPEIRENLDLFWPNRPVTVYATDGEADGADVIRARDVSFVELFSIAMKDLRARFPWAKNVFVLLEDLCPLGPVDEDKLARAQKLLRDNKKRFVTHVWWSHEASPWKTGEWDLSSTLSDGDVRLVPFASDYVHYNGLVACFWEIDHLETVIAEKQRLGETDPWSFENPLSGAQPDHYLFEGSWPTSNHGFYAKGTLHAKCLTQRGFPKSPLLSRLRKEYCGVDSYTVAKLKRIAQQTKSALRRRAERKSIGAANNIGAR